MTIINEEELRYVNGILDKLQTEFPLEELLSVSSEAAALIDDALVNDEPKMFLAIVYGLIAYGYMLRDDQDFSKKHKFSIDDFLGE